MRNETEVVIIGAGPYGLSLAAYLRAQNLDFRIFGKPMDTWANQMPQGMCLKSEGFASSLFDPDSTFTLEHFCKMNSIPYADTRLPVRRELFVEYGLEFQRKMVPELEEKTVLSVERSQGGFKLQLDSGEVVFAKKVVIAAGISHFQYVPPMLEGMPPEFVTHSSRHVSLDHFRGRDVTVIGAGSSALDLAGLLNAAGATARVIARKSVIHFHNPPPAEPRPLLDRVRAPMSRLGPGWRSWWCVKGPLLFHMMPQAFRLKVVQRHLGPATGWFVKQMIDGKVELNVGSTVKEVRIHEGRVRLQVANDSGESRWIETDHVIAGTGYQVDLKRLTFLREGLLEQIPCVRRAPVLSRSFESGVKGLYFVGAAAAPSFGPLLRFAYGAKFTAHRLSRHLARSASGVRVPGVSNPAHGAVVQPD